MPGPIRAVADDGSRIELSAAMWDGMPDLCSIWEFDGHKVMPSEATYQQWCDMLPTRELRARWRGLACLVCYHATDLCECSAPTELGLIP